MTTATSKVTDGKYVISPGNPAVRAVVRTVRVTHVIHHEYNVAVPRGATTSQLYEAVLNSNLQPHLVYSGGKMITAIDGKEFIGMRYVARQTNWRVLGLMFALVMVGSLAAGVVGVSLSHDCRDLRSGFSDYCNLQQALIGRY